jgi:hypothetical protein
MGKETVNLREKLREHKFEFGLLEKVPCTKKENAEYTQMIKNGEALPEGVHAYVYETNEFYEIHEADLTESEIQEYLTYKQLSLIRTIKNCVVFFTVLAVIGLVGALFALAGA